MAKKRLKIKSKKYNKKLFSSSAGRARSTYRPFKDMRGGTRA